MASFERIVDEGVLIGLSAARMAVTNHIIVGALREHRDVERGNAAEEGEDPVAPPDA